MGSTRSTSRRTRRCRTGLIERFFESLKAECVWLHRFEDRDHAFAVIARWMTKYHEQRPHSALGYLTPKEFPGEIRG